MKPANHCASRIYLSNTKGLATGTISGKAIFNPSERPLFIEALIARILRKPFAVKCSLRSTSLNTCLNNRK